MSTTIKLYDKLEQERDELQKQLEREHKALGDAMIELGETNRAKLDLLAACKDADALLNDTTAVRKILRAAIAKAERRAE